MLVLSWLSDCFFFILGTTGSKLVVQDHYSRTVSMSDEKTTAMQKQCTHTHTHILAHRLWPAPLFLEIGMDGREKRATCTRQVFEAKALMINDLRKIVPFQQILGFRLWLCSALSFCAPADFSNAMRKDGAGSLGSGTPVFASEDYKMRKPPHQQNRGDSNCKESLSARSY